MIITTHFLGNNLSMYRLPKTAYITHKINFTERTALLKELQNAPLKAADLAFVKDIIAGLSYKELSIKYNKSLSRIYQWKRSVFEHLADFDRIKK